MSSLVFNAVLRKRRLSMLHAPAIAATRPSLAERTNFCTRIGRLAVRSLYAELALYPKPGLVSFVDNGSHDDMSAQIFMRSLFSLRHYFIRIAKAGFDDAPFPHLKHLGIEAEKRMLAATGGVNTHRGAIFCLGMLCASIGWCHARRIALSPEAIRAALLNQWGEALAAHTRTLAPASHGTRVALHHGVSGAREEVALGLPSVFEMALPMLRQSLAGGHDWEAARVDALFALMAHVSDTNVYHRGGEEGAEFVKRQAREFLAAGGTARPGWKNRAADCHRAFVARRLSPGGAADLLAATCLVHDASAQVF
jgi:triphosphoribosyl-dephospho-CoA synthase